MFSVAPEPFDPIDMVPSFGSTFLFPNDNVVTSYCQRSISLPIVRVIKTPWFCRTPYQSDYFFTITSLDRENSYLSIPLQNSQDNDLPGRTPSSLPFPSSTEGGLIKFNWTGKRFSTLLNQSQTSTNSPKKFLYRSPGHVNPKPHPENRDSQYKIFYQLPFCGIRQSAKIPNRNISITGSTSTAFPPSITKLPRPPITAYRTSFHAKNIS